MSNKKTLRTYQFEKSEEGLCILKKYNLVYFACEVRTGKTAISLNTAKDFGAKKVLFLTKKKAIPSILQDYIDFDFHEHFDLVVINDESLHKIDDFFDLVIHDEHHRFGAFPKPNKTAKLFKERYSHLPMIFLSGTPHAESFSQVYHQFWISGKSPFSDYSNFYKWAKDYVNVKKVHLGYGIVNDYKHANMQLILKKIDKYFVRLTQEQAGFNTQVNEQILYCQMQPITYSLCMRLLKHKVIEGENETILADTAVKLQSKLHQLYSGTIKFESGNRKVIDYSKAEFIRDKFKGKKIGIFYKFKAEFDALSCIFKEDLTDNVEEFDNTNKNIALQIVSGREGISLKNADYLVYYNIDFSAISYWQSRDRLTTMHRKTNDVFWIFSKSGIESKIYQAVMNKKDYNLKAFKQDYGI